MSDEYGLCDGCEHLVWDEDEDEPWCEYECDPDDCDLYEEEL